MTDKKALFDDNLADIQNPIELDLFALEMKSRKMIHELVAPVVDRMNIERQRLAVHNERQQQMEVRVASLEHICDVKGTKPKIFEVISNEFADLKEQQAYLESRLLEQIELLKTKMQQQQEEIDKMTNLSVILTNKADSLDVFTRDIRANLSSMNERLMGSLYECRQDFEETMRVTMRDLKGLELQMLNSQQRLTDSIERVESIEKIMQANGKELVRITQMALEMKVNKVDVARFDSTMENVQLQVNTVKYAVQDTFRTLLATDNYLQKYMPFQVQQIVSENFKNCLKGSENHDTLMRQKDFEYQKYKELHKKVMLDNGIPNLQKRGFFMAGGVGELVVNENDNFIPELGQRVVSLEWFLSRHNEPVTDEQVIKSGGDLMPKPTPGLIIREVTNERSGRNNIQSPSKQLTHNPQPQQPIIQEEKSMEQSSLHFAKSNPVSKMTLSDDRNGGMLSEQTETIQSNHSPAPKFLKRQSLKMDGRSPNTGGRAFQIGMDDLEPELADEFQAMSKTLKEVKDDCEKLQRQVDHLKENLVILNRDESTKFRLEVRSTLGEHFEYIKELHSQLESQLSKNRQEQNLLIQEFRVAQGESLKHGSLEERQEQLSVLIKQVRDSVDRINEALLLQSQLNMIQPGAVNLSLERPGSSKEVDQQVPGIRTSFRKGSKRELERNHQSNLSYQHIKVSTANLQLPGNGNNRAQQVKTNFMSYDHIDTPLFSPSNSDLNHISGGQVLGKTIAPPTIETTQQERSPDQRHLLNQQFLMKRNELALQIRQLAEIGKSFNKQGDIRKGVSQHNLHSKQRLLSPTASQQQAYYQHGSNHLASGSIRDLSTINSNNSPPRVNDAVWNVPQTTTNAGARFGMNMQKTQRFRAQIGEVNVSGSIRGMSAQQLRRPVTSGQRSGQVTSSQLSSNGKLSSNINFK